MNRRTAESRLIPRLQRERRTINVMIALYCRGNHANHHVAPAPRKLCNQCQELSDYAMRRINKCPFGECKPTCVKCTIHCYNPAMRERIRQVMRYAGPRMPLHHPILTLRHYLDQFATPSQ